MERENTLLFRLRHIFLMKDCLKVQVVAHRIVTDGPNNSSCDEQAVFCRPRSAGGIQIRRRTSRKLRPVVIIAQSLRSDNRRPVEAKTILSAPLSTVDPTLPACYPWRLQNHPLSTELLLDQSLFCASPDGQSDVGIDTTHNAVVILALY